MWSVAQCIHLEVLDAGSIKVKVICTGRLWGLREVQVVHIQNGAAWESPGRKQLKTDQNGVRSVAQCIHLDVGRMNVKVNIETLDQELADAAA